MKKKMIVFYVIPTIFIGMILVYWKENIFTWMMFFAGLIIPVIIAYLYVKKGGNISGVLAGNVLCFLTNIVPVLYFNKIKLAKETGQMWHGYFKPLYTEQLFILIFVVLLIIEIIIYRVIKNK